MESSGEGSSARENWSLSRSWSGANPLFVAVVVWGVVGWLWWNRQSRFRRVAGPKAWPVIGSTMELVQNWDRLHDWLHEFFSSDVRSCHVVFAYPSPPGVYTVDPANVEYILKTNFANYPKGVGNCIPLQELFGIGIFTTDGELWKEQRRTASYQFSTSSLRDFSTGVFRDYACQLASLVAHFASAREEFDLQDLCMRMTLESTCRIGFGVSLECLAPEMKSIPFAQSFDDANYISYHRYCDPLWRVKRWMNVGHERQLKQCVRVLDEFSLGVIANRRKEMAAGSRSGSQKLDLLSGFIDLCNRDQVGLKPVFTNTALRDMILNFIIAGRDTTAVTLTWFFYMMTCHPKVADKIVDELATVVGQHPNTKDLSTQTPANIEKQQQSLASAEAMAEFGSLLTFEALGKLHYLQAALSETLRLYPAVPIDTKEAATDDVLPDGTAVKGGNLMGYVPYAMGRMAFIWGDDAAEFRPERWLRQDGSFQPQPPFQFTAFQAGPRTCLGKDSAYLQMKMAAAMMLRFFELRLVPGHPVRYRTMLVLALQHGLRITATPRSWPPSTLAR